MENEQGRSNKYVNVCCMYIPTLIHKEKRGLNRLHNFSSLVLFFYFSRIIIYFTSYLILNQQNYFHFFISFL